MNIRKFTQKQMTIMIWSRNESKMLIVALFVFFLLISILCYDPWVDKKVCSLGYRLRSRVALGVGVVSNHVL